MSLSSDAPVMTMPVAPSNSNSGWGGFGGDGWWIILFVIILFGWGGTVEAITAALAINGEPLTSATATVTPAAVENYFNIYVAANVNVPRGCCLTVAAENTSGQAINFANSNLIVERIA